MRESVYDEYRSIKERLDLVGEAADLLKEIEEEEAA